MEQCRPKILICVTLVVWSIFLLRDSHLIANESGKWLGPPSMETFENYEKYINEMNAKARFKYQNPISDAYGYHQNLVKRGATTENTPKMFKFGVEDAREPDAATKEIIRKHRAQELKDKDKIGKRIKRRAPKTEPRFIKFDVTDAKEPDEITKELIRQSRAKELKTKSDNISLKTTRPPQRLTHKRKRTKRSTQLTQPQFIKFELADAREPKQNINERVQNMQSLESKLMSINSGSYHQSNETDSEVEESKKIFVYQAVPSKSKRVANAIPIEVKKIIDIMIKDNKAQAYYKYMGTDQEAKLKSLGKFKDSFTTGMTPQLSPVKSKLVNIYQAPAYVQKLVPIHIPVQSIPVSPLPSLPLSHSTGPSAHPTIVPGTINSQGFYHPIATISHSQPQTVFYQQPAPYPKVVPAMTQIFKEIPIVPVVPQQQISHLSTNTVASNEVANSNTYANIIPLNGSFQQGKLIHFYPKLENQPLISPNDNALNVDLTNQAQQKMPTQNEINKEQQITLKDNQEFQELSSLIGKSPTDQIHGLAYLLAKEMQRNKRLMEQRPQDNTSPILFHPDKKFGVGHEASHESGELPTQPELISHPVSEPLPQTYSVEIQQNLPANHVSGENAEPSAPVPPPTPPPTSYSVVKNLGLSPNYAGIDQFDESPKIQPDVENELGLQYASKYAFGYRVRDFYSGNDFGHKQNRDLDGVTRGQYHILLPDGRVQNVIYHADDTGFHADVSFETGHR